MICRKKIVALSFDVNFFFFKYLQTTLRFCRIITNSKINLEFDKTISSLYYIDINLKFYR